MRGIGFNAGSVFLKNGNIPNGKTCCGFTIGSVHGRGGLGAFGSCDISTSGAPKLGSNDGKLEKGVFQLQPALGAIGAVGTGAAGVTGTGAAGVAGATGAVVSLPKNC